MIHPTRALLAIVLGLAGAGCALPTDAPEIGASVSATTSTAPTSPGGYELTIDTTDGFERAY
jgi:hypothetical protein